MKETRHEISILIGKLQSFGFNQEAEGLKKIAEYISEYKSDQKQAIEVVKSLEETKKWLEQNPEPEIESMSKTLNEISEHQKMFETVKKMKDDWMAVQELEKGINKMTEDLKTLKEAKKTVFANSKLPVKDLELDENEGILYKGLPFNQDHHPTSRMDKAYHR